MSEKSRHGKTTMLLGEALKRAIQGDNVACAYEGVYYAVTVTKIPQPQKLGEFEVEYLKGKLES